MSHLKSKIIAMKDEWNRLSSENSFNYVSHLQPGAKWDLGEFHLTGIRFVDRIAERFAGYGGPECGLSEIAEIGCGVGRFTKVMAARFKHVHAFDISDKMLADAVKYCCCMPNITFINNDGTSLEYLADDSVDYACSAGVFQHITHIEVILAYVREALRVLKPGGLFLFQFEANRTADEGRDSTGARIHAQALDQGLAGQPYEIIELSLDPKDAVRNMVVVLRKSHNAPDGKQSFASFPLTERRWISGVYDDIKTKAVMHERLKRPPLPLTFYELPAE